MILIYDKNIKLFIRTHSMIYLDSMELILISRRMILHFFINFPSLQGKNTKFAKRTISN